MGIQWSGIRKHDIEEPYEQFKTVSNEKRRLVIAAIQESLEGISACEAKMARGIGIKDTGSYTTSSSTTPISRHFRQFRAPGTVEQQT
jgi:hypothetical protein